MKKKLWTYSLLQISRELKNYIIGPILSVKAMTKNPTFGYFNEIRCELHSLDVDNARMKRGPI